MASIGLFETFIAFLCFLIFFYFLRKKPYGYFLTKKSLESYLWSWPVLWMLPRGLLRVYLLRSIEILDNSKLTFQFKGPWFSEMDMLVTVDPSNIHHIMSSNFSNYIKGLEFQEIFEVFGDSIITTNSELWKNMRKASQTMLNHQGFRRLSMSITRSKLKDGLLPLFNHSAEEQTEVDLQDVFQRLLFDTTCFLIIGYDPRSLSIEMPEVEFIEALDDVELAIRYRFIIPRLLWKLQKWIGLGTEKKLSEANATFDRLCMKYISAKREELKSQRTDHVDSNNREAEDLLTSHIKLDETKYELLNPGNDRFLRDFIVTFMAAGRDTTSSSLTWFFWLLSKNPDVATKIRQEINTNLPKMGSEENMSSYLNKLVYLHGALNEAIRLYPPIPIADRSSVKQDILPSGHEVKPNTEIMINIYALGRKKAVWGEDAMEFKPERWVSEKGLLRHEPSNKFFSFIAGPRTCPGKHLAMVQMKTVVVEILQNYDIEVVKGQKIEPKLGPVLNMKNGLNITLAKRCSTSNENAQIVLNS